MKRFWQVLRNIPSFMTYSFWWMFFWRVYLYVFKREIIVLGTCNQCGACCASLCLEGDGGWVKTVEEFEALQNENLQYTRFNIIGKSGSYKLFSCNSLGEKGSCMEYDRRPNFCRNYPQPSLLSQGAHLPEGCGFYFVVQKSSTRKF